MKYLSKHLSSILDAIHLNDEIFALGSTSESIGRCIISCSGPHPLRKQSAKHIAMILVDRVNMQIAIIAKANAD